MANTKSLHNFSFGNATHVGMVRQVNEDYFGNFETKNGYIFLVCDGMGGHVGGAKASQIAVEVIRDNLQHLDYPNPFEALSQSITAANNAILAYAEKEPELMGMGTTCVAVLVIGSDIYYAHVGDSRIYLFSNRKLSRLTKDHSFVQNMVDLGGITEEEAENHPRKNEITNALGIPNMKPPTVCKAPIYAARGDMFLLCSDGLTGMVKDSEIEAVLKSKTELQGKANMLIEAANHGGGKDNITVQLIEITHSLYKKTATHIPAAQTATNQDFKSSKSILISTILVLVLAMCGGTVFILKNKIFPQNERIPEHIIHDSTERSNVAPQIDTTITNQLNKEIDKKNKQPVATAKNPQTKTTAPMAKTDTVKTKHLDKKADSRNKKTSKKP